MRGLLVLALALAAAQSPPSPEFIDASPGSGLTHRLICGDNERKSLLIETLGAGLALFDYDNDGILDLFTVNASARNALQDPQPSNHLYRGLGNLKFVDVTEAAGLTRSGWGQGVCAGDIDNDGFTDLFVTYYGSDRLYRNSGHGTFEDLSAAAGLVESAKRETRWGTGCAFLDYNLDGKLDLFIANYVQFDEKNTPVPGQPNACRWKDQPVPCGPLGLQGGKNRLYKNISNKGALKFEDVSKQSGIGELGLRYSLSASTIDYDHDGWPDIYVAVDSQPSLLYHNNRDGTFTDRGIEAGVALSEDGREQAGMGTAVIDFDGDGNLDLLKTNFVDDLPNLYRNRSDGSFEESTISSGLGKHRQFMGWGTALLDFDNDGWPDIFMVNGHIYPNLKGVEYEQRRLLYRNLGNGRFSEVAPTGALAMKKSSRGLATGDLDNDGDIDLLISNLNEPPTVLRNDGGNRLNYLNIRLIGQRSNRSAIGARVTVSVGARAMVQELRSGASFLSQNDFRLHFGLGSAIKVDRIDIEWPGGTKQSSGPTASNQFLTITESSKP